MRVLLLAKGNVPTRFNLVAVNCENYAVPQIGPHEVRTFGYNHGVDYPISPVGDFAEVLAQLPADWQPDVCILWEIDWNLVPRGIENAPFPVVAIIWDWDYDMACARSIVEIADFSLVLAKFEHDAVAALGANRVSRHYYIGVMREYFAERPKPIAGRPIDVLYTTAINDAERYQRSLLVEQLSTLADHYNVRVEALRPDYRDYCRLLASAKLALTHHRHGSMSGRLLEAAAQGTVALETGVEVAEHFSEGKEYLAVSIDDIAQQVASFLAEPQRLEAISQAAYEKVTAQFEARQRWLQMLDHIAALLPATRPRSYLALAPAEQARRRGELYYYAFFRSPGNIIDGRARMLEQAVLEFERACQCEPSARAHDCLAVARAAHGLIVDSERFIAERGQSAIASLAAALAIDASYLPAIYHAGVIQLRCNDLDNAFASFSQVYQLLQNPALSIDPWTLYFNKATGAWSGEDVLLQQAINRALLLEGQGDKQSAAAVLHAGYLAMTLDYLSMICQERADLISASQLAALAATTAPESGRLLARAADLARLLGDRQTARAFHQQALQRLPLEIEEHKRYLAAQLVDGLPIDRELRHLRRLYQTVGPLRQQLAETINELEIYRALTSGAQALRYPLLDELQGQQNLERLYQALNAAPGSVALVEAVINGWLAIEQPDQALAVLERYAELADDQADRTLLTSWAKKIRQSDAAPSV